MAQPRLSRLHRSLLGVLLTSPALIGSGQTPLKVQTERNTLLLDSKVTAGRGNPVPLDRDECDRVCHYVYPPPDPTGQYRSAEVTRCVATTAATSSPSSDAGASTAWVVECEYEVQYHLPPQSCGRQLAGWNAPEHSGRGLGAYLAANASLERAAVDAFDHMVNELVYHAAPTALIDRASRAKVDEEHHAVAMDRLAARHNATPLVHPSASLPLRTLFEMAVENVTEGCVRETYGALVALHQSMHASNASVRKAMRRIAQDEVKHAELSWDLHAWFTEHLSEHERQLVLGAASVAVARLRADLAIPFARDLSDQAGIPDAQLAAHFVDQLDREVWQRELARSPLPEGSRSVD